MFGAGLGFWMFRSTLPGFRSMIIIVNQKENKVGDSTLQTQSLTIMDGYGITSHRADPVLGWDGCGSGRLWVTLICFNPNSRSTQLDYLIGTLVRDLARHGPFNRKL